MSVRVLVVDDNPRFLETATRVLRGEGMTVVGTAVTSGEALDQAREKEPDVAVVDIALGSESGFDLARLLAGGGESGVTRVILCSTYDAEQFADLIEGSPAIGFLPKSRLSAGAIAEILAEHGGDESRD